VALDKVIIGERIRKIREETLNESRKNFALKCGLTERYIGQIERGDFLISLKMLDKIATAISIDIDYILYGKAENDKYNTRQALHNIIDKCDKKQVDMFYKCLTTMISYEVSKYKNGV